MRDTSTPQVDWSEIATGVRSRTGRESDSTGLERHRVHHQVRRGRPGLVRLGLVLGGASLLVVVAFAIRFAGSPSSPRSDLVQQNIPEPDQTRDDFALDPRPEPSASGVDQGVGAVDWWSVLQGLDSVRANAIADADATQLLLADARASPALTRDSQTISSLLESGERADGLSWTVLGIETVENCPDITGDWCLTIVDRRESYRIVDKEGGLIRVVSGSDRERWNLRMRPAPSVAAADPGWRFAEVRHGK